MNQALDTVAGLLTGEANALLCNWSALRFQHTMAIRGHLIEHYKPATVNKILSALRGVLKAAWLLGQITAEDYHKAITVSSVHNRVLPAGRELSSEEITALLATCYSDDKPSGVRDAALITMLYATGLRRAEVVSLDLADYRDRQYIVVKGKGHKERRSWLNEQAVTILDLWLEQRGTWNGPLFCPVNKSRKIIQRRLTAQAIYYILKRRGAQAAVTAFSPHDLRRTFVSNLLDAGADISIVSQMAGHANVQTTARYDRRSEDAKRQAASRLHISLPEENDDFSVDK